LSTIWHRDRGFTLLELLVAMAIMVILTAALYGTYFSVMRGRESAAAGMESRRELRGTLDLLRREIASAYFTTNTGVTKNLLKFVVEDRDIFGKPASILNFTCIVPPRSGSLPCSDQREVTYRVVERDKRLVLTRQEKELYSDAKPAEYPQMEELEGFLVECENSGKWVKTWDTVSNANGKLPTAVRITIRLKEGDGFTSFSAIATPKVN
jgi:general secretion pathway protein J